MLYQKHHIHEYTVPTIPNFAYDLLSSNGTLQKYQYQMKHRLVQGNQRNKI
jgi:hypothetical protein